MRKPSTVIGLVAAVLLVLATVMGYVGGVRADESRPLGIAAWLWPTLGLGLLTALVAAVLRTKNH